MDKGLILGLGAAGVAYYLYSQGYFSAAASPVLPVAASTPAGTTTQAASAPAATASTPTIITPAPAPPASLTAPLSAAMVAQMTAAAPAFFGKSTVPTSASGFQWDALANSVFGASHVTLSQMGIAGANTMSLTDYMQKYLNVLAAQTVGLPVGSIAGLGRVALVLPRRGRVILLPRNYRRIA